MGCFSPQNIHEAIIIHMINRKEHSEAVMSIVIMGFVQYLKDKGVYCFARVCLCVCFDMHAKCKQLDSEGKS